MLLPTTTGSGLSTFVTERSALPAAAATVVVAVAELFAGLGSVVVEETDAVLVMTVPPAVAPSTATTSVNDALPAIMLAFVQEIEPVAPTAGVVQLHPPGDDSTTNVVFAGTESVSVTFAAAFGPALLTVIV